MSTALRSAHADALGRRLDALDTCDRRWLELLLAPLDLPTFFGRYWDQAPVHIGGNPRTGFADLWDRSGLERLLAHSQLPLAQVEVIGAGGSAPAPRRTVSGRPILDLRRIAEHVQRRGGGIRVHGIETYVPSVRDLADRLGPLLGATVAVNAYYTTPRLEGLSLHWDTHDVLVLQLDGAKHWTLYEPPIERPIPPYHRSTLYSLEPGEPTWEGVVRAGELLYVPRGTPHLAKAFESSSLHLACGFVLPTWHDLLRSLSERVLARCAEDPMLRRSAPLFLGEGTIDDDAIEQLHEALRRQLAQPDHDALRTHWTTALVRPRSETWSLPSGDPVSPEEPTR